ncbi:MAG: hypothetical protein H7210_02210 [Pyrinomonadaceae bacterium]|nr:hypothetical protein [Phycisphaerales bacterium]
MPGHRETLFLEISRTRRQLSVQRGKDITVLRVEYPDHAESSNPIQAPQTTAQASQLWIDSVAEFAPTLARWVAELGLSGRRVVVEYVNPDSTTSIFSCPSSTGAGHAPMAARLALAQAISYPLASAAHDARVLCTDSAGSTDAKGEAKPPLIHCLVAADSDASASAVCNCVENAGLVPIRLVPASAAMLHAAASMVLNRCAANTCSLVLWIGEQGSVIAAGGPHRLALARFFPTGIETLVDSLSRPQPFKGTDSLHALMTRPAAREMLFSTGIPHSDENQDPSSEKAAAITIPLLRPVLQRLAVETRQSLRFGLSKEEREGARIVLAGPGAAIRNLAEALGSENSDAHIVGAFEYAESEPHSSQTASTNAPTLAPVVLDLLPESFKSALRVRQLRRAMWIGVAAAGIAVAADGIQTRLALMEQHRTLTVLQDQAAHPSPTPLVVMQAAAARQGVVQAELRIQQKMCGAPESAALLALLGKATPPYIRLRSIELTCQQGVWTARVMGGVKSSSGSSPAARVKEFVDNIAAAPVVSRARLGSTQLGKSDDGDILTFEMSIGFVPLQRGAHGLTSQPLTAATDTAETTGGRP